MYNKSKFSTCHETQDYELAIHSLKSFQESLIAILRHAGFNDITVLTRNEIKISNLYVTEIIDIISICRYSDILAHARLIFTTN